MTHTEYEEELAVRIIMTHTEYEEELAVRIITDHLNLQTRNNRSLTKIKEDPPDIDFEIGDHKIGCEVVHFHLIDQPAKEKGKNLANEGAIKHNIVKGIQRSLQEKGIPPLMIGINFITHPTEVPKNVEKIVNIITIMHKKSITQSQIYERTEQPRRTLQIIQRNQHIKHTDFVLNLARPGKYR